eukprot:4224589-Alexandrium_andersonii.AAC.1
MVSAGALPTHAACPHCEPEGAGGAGASQPLRIGPLPTAVAVVVAKLLLSDARRVKRADGV